MVSDIDKGGDYTCVGQGYLGNLCIVLSIFLNKKLL